MNPEDINKKISENDDHLAAAIVSRCWDAMEGYPTVTKMKACYNLTAGVLRLFCVLGKKEDVIDLVDKLYEGLMDEIEELFS